MAPLTNCSAVECREIRQQACCYENIVFGVVGGPNAPTYEQDFNTFLINFPLATVNPLVSVTMILQKLIASVWTDLATLTGSTYGRHYPLNGFSSHKSYTGYAINWGKVLNLHGTGCYRFKIISELSQDDVGVELPPVLQSCQVSELFRLYAFDCKLAHQTVKFESTISGKIGDINADGKIFDLCDIAWYDSIRFRGFFGYETTPEYLEVLHEFQNGKMNRVRDEAIQKFKLITHLLPKWLHDRFKTYALMANKLLVSDYNINNSDYAIIQKSVIKDGGYEPDYKDKNWRRLARVEVNFKEAVQSVIKSNCCESQSARG